MPGFYPSPTRIVDVRSPSHLVKTAVQFGAAFDRRIHRHRFVGTPAGACLMPVPKPTTPWYNCQARRGDYNRALADK